MGSRASHSRGTQSVLAVGAGQIRGIEGAIERGDTRQILRISQQLRSTALSLGLQRIEGAIEDMVCEVGKFNLGGNLEYLGRLLRELEGEPVSSESRYRGRIA